MTSDAALDLHIITDSAGKDVGVITGDGALVIRRVIETDPANNIAERSAYYEAMDGQYADKASELVEFTIFDSVVDGYPVFRAPVLLRISRTEYLAIAERRDSDSDFARMDLVCRPITYDPVANAVTLGNVVLIDQGVAGTPATSKLNPCAVLVRTGTHAGRIVLLYLHRKTDNSEVIAYRTYSDDDGATWAAPVDYTATYPADRRSVMAPGPGKAVQLKTGAYAGRIIAPVWTASSTYPTAGYTTASALIYSDDGGDTWTYGAVSPIPRSTECYAVESPTGEVILVQRLEGLDYQRGLSYTDDGGQTFSRHETSASAWPDISSVICQSSIINPAYDVKAALPKLVYVAPVGVGLTRSRSNLTIWVSYDGASFPYRKEITSGYSGYSDLEPFTRDRFGILYESITGYRRLTLALVNLASIME